MFSHSRAPRPWLALALIVAAITASAGCSSARGAPAGDYLALGDSIAFGFRPSAVTSRATYADAGNFTGYPELVAKATGMSVTNAACPGESSTSLITAGASDNGCTAATGETRAGYRSHSPLHARYSGSQLAFAVSFLRSHKRTHLVTLNIGVNDLTVCHRMTPTHCTGSAAATQLAETSRNVATIFTTLREQAGYQGTLVLLTNYPPSYAPVQAAPYRALDAALVTAATESGARVADGFGELQRASEAFGGNPCRAGLLVRLPTGKCNYHPSAQGQQLLADAVEKAIAN